MWEGASAQLDLSTILVIVALICAFGSVHAGVQIANDLRSRGISAKPILVRWMIFHYMAEYRRVTLEETGQVGPLYQRCATISALTAIFGISAILAKLL